MSLLTLMTFDKLSNGRRNRSL